MKFTQLLAILAASWGAGCASLAIASAPEKEPQPSRSALSVGARADFRQALLGGDYAALPQVTERLTQAYLAHPADPEVALLLAHAHLWRVVERKREAEQKAGATDHLVLAERYFDEALRLNPDDRRIDGWLGGVRLALGTVNADEKLKRRAYFQLQDAKNAFPEFNDFSASYAMARLPATDPRFAEVVEDMWHNVDVCAGSPVPRDAPSFARYMARETHEGDLRVCWSTATVPHNFEGFFLHFGDVLTKQGNANLARKMYANARLSRSYGSWRYQDVLAERIASVDARVAAFRGADARQHPESMVDSTFACTACHAR